MNTRMDTTRETTIEELTEMLINRGFERVLFEKYAREAYGQEEESYLFVFWQKELNIMISGTTYPIYDFSQEHLVQVGHSINSGTMYYKVKPKGELNRNLLSTFSMKEDGSFEGSHSIRRGIISILDSLIEEFDFLPWTNERHLWLVHYTEEKQNSEKDYYDVVTYRNMKKLPEYVKEAIHSELYKMEDKTQITLLKEYVKNHQEEIKSAMLSYDIDELKSIDARADYKRIYLYKESEESFLFIDRYDDIVAEMTITEGEISLDVKELMHPFFYEFTESFEKILITKKEVVKAPLSMRELAHAAICIAISDMEIGSKLKGDFAPDIRKTAENLLSVDMQGMSVCQIIIDNKEVVVIPGEYYQFWDAPMIGWGNIILETLAKNGGFEIVKK